MDTTKFRKLSTKLSRKMDRYFTFGTSARKNPRYDADHWWTRGPRPAPWVDRSTCSRGLRTARTNETSWFIPNRIPPLSVLFSITFELSSMTRAG